MHIQVAIYERSSLVKANRWYGKQDLRIEEAPDPQIEEPGDAIVKMELGTICGSDLHLYNGYLQPLSEKIQQGEIDPTFVISHQVTLEEVPTMYERWNNKEDGVVKVAWTP